MSSPMLAQKHMKRAGGYSPMLSQKGSGFISDLNIPIISGLAGLIGLGMRKPKGGLLNLSGGRLPVAKLTHGGLLVLSGRRA